MQRFLILTGLVAVGVISLAAFLWWTLPDPGSVAVHDPRTTAVIEQRRAEAGAARRPFRLYQVWVPLSRISPRLVQAVLISEDASFYGHAAFDWHEVRAAADDTFRSGKPLRGASTVTQQVAKNLWLGTNRTAWRKVKEAVLATKMERTLPKRRILALYLNVAEWGEGVFGVEAAAQRHFGVPAESVSTAQAVVLAAMLPAPRLVNIAHPSRWLSMRASRILDRLHAAGRIDAGEHARASAELTRLLHGVTDARAHDGPLDAEVDGRL